MSEKIVFVKFDEWLKNFYNLSEEMPLFKKDWESIKEGNLAYDFQSGYQAALEWLDSKDSKNNPDLQEKLKTFVKKWPLMLHLNNLMEQEDLPKAQETLLSLKEVDGRDPSVYFHLGYIQKRLGKTEESINNYHKCIELYPDFLAAYTNLARTYTEIGERDKAVELLRKALEIQPGDVYILEELAALKEVFPVFTQPGNYESLVYIEKKDYQKAIEKEIEKVESPEELFNLANILMQDTLYNSALKAINRYLELEKDNKLNGWLFKAELMRITENLEQTERLLQEIENQFSELPADYYFILAKMQIQQNKISEAIDSLQKLIETDFNHTEGLNLYYFLLKELNRDEDVLEELVGEIRDEYDEEETGKIQKIDDKTYIIDPSATLNDFYDATGITITDEDYETIGGFTIHKADRLLKKGEVVKTDRFKIEVLDVDGYRITKIKLTVEDKNGNKENKD
jgi:tetratricopeptide (TPR) repeat protein